MKYIYDTIKDTKIYRTVDDKVHRCDCVGCCQIQLSTEKPCWVTVLSNMWQHCYILMMQLCCCRQWKLCLASLTS